jgi:predicted nucleotidyltransferase component of viral defense system
MDLKEIRRIVIIALFSDDELMEKFVLKGGNALDIIHSIGTRSSVDVDISMPDDFADLEDAKRRIFKGLRDRFDAVGFVVFDETFEPKPSQPRPGQDPRWGGYLVEFKIISRTEYEKHHHDQAALQRNALVVSPGNKRRFKVDISKFEFCTVKQEYEVDSFTVYAYTLPMMALEKLRAICQQMPDYAQRSHPRPRARDFYDIHTVVMAGKLDLTSAENLELLKHIFEAKEVPLSFLSKIKETHDFHIVDWPSVRQTVSGDIEEFDFYFDFVVGLVNRLEAAGIK